MSGMPDQGSKKATGAIRRFCLKHLEAILTIPGTALVTWFLHAKVIPETVAPYIVIGIVSVFLLSVSLLAWREFFSRHDHAMNRLLQKLPYRVRVHLQGDAFSAFHECAARARSARHEIVVVGPHFNPQVPLHSLAHAEYLHNGIGAAVRRHSQDVARDGRRFKYSRLMQLPVETFREVKKNRGTLYSSNIHDDPTFLHLSEMVRYRVGSAIGGVEIDVRARKFVPSFPSTLIIDNRYMFFSLPADIGNGSSDSSAASGEASRPLHFGVVLEIEDRSGDVIRDFRTLIDSLKGESIEILHVKPESDRPPNSIERGSA